MFLAQSRNSGNGTLGSKGSAYVYCDDVTFTRQYREDADRQEIVLCLRETYLQTNLIIVV